MRIKDPHISECNDGLHCPHLLGILLYFWHHKKIYSEVCSNLIYYKHNGFSNIISSLASIPHFLVVHHTLSPHSLHFSHCSTAQLPPYYIPRNCDTVQLSCHITNIMFQKNSLSMQIHSTSLIPHSATEALFGRVDASLFYHSSIRPHFFPSSLFRKFGSN